MLTREGYARYAKPVCSGTAALSQQDKLSGWKGEYQLAALRINDSSSYLDLSWPEGRWLTDISEPLQLRLTLANEIVTYPYLSVSIMGQKEIGQIDLSMGCIFQIGELTLKPEDLKSIASHGLRITLKGAGEDASLIISSVGSARTIEPHILIPGSRTPLEEFRMRLKSMDAVTGYGWKSACVLGGLYDLARSAREEREESRKLLLEYLERYYPEPYVLPKFWVEGTGGTGVLAQYRPDHPEIEGVITFIKHHRDTDGFVLEHDVAVTESNYNVAWPMAALGRLRHDNELTDIAITHLRQAKERLVDLEGAIWLRQGRTPEGGIYRTYKLWSRGIAWYFLGLMRALDELEQPPADLIEEAKQRAAALLPYQDEEGCWKVFADDPQTLAESSGTAGIASALAIGVRKGWFGSKEAEAARHAYEGLKRLLTPDGLIRNVSHSNKHAGGEEFQRNSKGAILQYGMGMFAQLVAEMENAD